MGNHNHIHSHRLENIKVAVFLNVAFTLIEFFGGLWTKSLAILSDALHDFGDSIVLLASLFLEKQAGRPPDHKRTFGYRRLSVFAALLAAIVLISGSIFILVEAVKRLISPVHVNASGMILLALLGIFFNTLGFLRLKKGGSLNEKVLSWHLLEDVLGWVVIFVGSIVIRVFDFHRLDPLMTLGYTSFILYGVFKNLKEVFNILLEGAPSNVSLETVRSAIESIPGVLGVHDLHVWSLDGETNYLTAHVEVENYQMQNKICESLTKGLKKFRIVHSTFEFEERDSCRGRCH